MTTTKLPAAIAFSLLVAACGERGTNAPPRPASVPPAAVWAGGVDGGAWLDCRELPGAPGRYRCAAYDDYTGSVWAEGDYVLRLSRWNKTQSEAQLEPAARPSTLRYDAFDGEVVHLAGSLVLVPDGWIKYPSGNGGEKQRFELGVPQGEAAPY
jgi:hypothetical protein